MYYVFVGQLNTTSGSPHPVTGSLNTYGDLIAFTTRKKRDEYYNSFYSNNGFESCIKTNKQDAKREFFGGMTQRDYDDYLRYVDNREDV